MYFDFRKNDVLFYLYSVTAGGITQMREVGLNSNHSSHNPLEQHFGLGSESETTVDEISIVWPALSEDYTVLSEVAVNQMLRIKYEGF